MSYNILAAGAVYRFLQFDYLDLVSLYVKMGLAHTQNSVSDSRINYERAHDFGLYFGLGAARCCIRYRSDGGNRITAKSPGTF